MRSDGALCLCLAVDVHRVQHLGWACVVLCSEGGVVNYPHHRHTTRLLVFLGACCLFTLALSPACSPLVIEVAVAVVVALIAAASTHHRLNDCLTHSRTHARLLHLLSTCVRSALLLSISAAARGTGWILCIAPRSS